jgi:hypothetical protein
MATTTLSKRIFAGGGGRGLTGLVVLAGMLAGLGTVSGCSNPAEAEVPKAEVKTVEAYGVTLGPEASPQQVSWVLLKSVADDYAAARAKDAEAQKKAQATTMAVAAPNKIEERLVQTANQINPNLKKQSLGEDRDRKIFKTVHYWAPIVGHYVASFANMDLQTFVRESWVTTTPDGQIAHVYLPVSHDPAQTDPAKAETATLNIELSREKAEAGGPEYWRVSRVQFLGRQFRAPTVPAEVQAYGMTLDESAAPAQVASAVLRSLGEMVAAEKAGAKDVRASGMYRVFNLAYPAKAQEAGAGREASKTGETDDKTTQGLAQAVFRWAGLVAPVATGDAAAFDPARMQQTDAAGSDTVRVIYSPGQAGAEKITVDLAQQQAGGKSFWRVVNVTTEASAGQTAPQPAPATQAANP